MNEASANVYHLEAETSPLLQFAAARSHWHLYEAFHLLQRRYVAAGLSGPHQSIRVEPFHLWDQSQVLIALRDNLVVGCITLIRPGNPVGLPVKQSHPEVFAELPRRAKVGEVTSLAVDAGMRSWELLIGLTQSVQQSAFQSGIDYLVAVVHPRHARFYERALGFRIVGRESPCSRVAGKPGVAMIAKIDQATLCRPQWQSRFAPHAETKGDLRPAPMSPKQREFFARYVEDHQRNRIAA